MKDNLIYSTTIRTVGKKNNIDNFKLGLERIEHSKFNYANLNYCLHILKQLSLYNWHYLT